MTSLDRQHIEQLLPFYLNGSLETTESKLVEQAMQQDLSLQQDLDFLRSLQQQTQQKTMATSPGEIGLKRLLRQIQQPVSIAASTSQPTQGWKWAAIAASLLLVVQTSTTLLPSDDYQAAGQQGKHLQPDVSLTVTFSPDVSEQQLRDLLIQHRITIIDGPSALGVYQLQLTHQPATTLERLKARNDIFDSIQSD